MSHEWLHYDCALSCVWTSNVQQTYMMSHMWFGSYVVILQHRVAGLHNKCSRNPSMPHKKTKQIVALLLFSSSSFVVSYNCVCEMILSADIDLSHITECICMGV